MKKTFLLISILIFTNCKYFKSSKTETSEPKTEVIIPEKGQYGEIKDFKIGCNFNNSINKSLIKIYSPNEKELYEIKKIANFTGLPQNFKIFQANINNASATIIDDQRYILYDKNLLDFANRKTETFWASISIFAHEIGHHLAGHTLNQLTDNHQAELEADKFSGFILYKMGATKSQSIKAISTIASKLDSKSHPARSKRINEILNGWEEAYVQDYQSALPPPLNDSPNKFNEYTMEMLYNEEFYNYYSSKDLNEKYEFHKGVVIDNEVNKFNQISNVTIAVTDNLNNSKRYNLTLWIDFGKDMCKACWNNLPYTLKPGRRVKFAFNEGHPRGGTAYNGVLNLSYLKVISNQELKIQPKTNSSNNFEKENLINEFLKAEQIRKIDEVLNFYSLNIKRYWNYYNIDKNELKRLYQNTWKKSSSAINEVEEIIKLNNNTYIVKTHFKYYSKKEHIYKSIESKVRFVFDNNNKITETNRVE